MDEITTMNERVGVAHLLGMMVGGIGVVVIGVAVIAAAGAGLWFLGAAILQAIGGLL